MTEQTTKVHCDPTKKHDFVLVFDVADGNPNGDPDAGNLPRTDPETMEGLVTDVALKRKVRNFVEIVSEEQDQPERLKIFVEHHGVLNDQIRRAGEQERRWPGEGHAANLYRQTCKLGLDVGHRRGSLFHLEGPLEALLCLLAAQDEFAPTLAAIVELHVFADHVAFEVLQDAGRLARSTVEHECIGLAVDIDVTDCAPLGVRHEGFADRSRRELLDVIGAQTME